MNKTKAYSKVSRQLTAILKKLDDWDDPMLARKSIGMARSEEFRAVYRRLLSTKRWKVYTARLKARWPGLLDEGSPYPVDYLDAEKEWLEKNEKDQYLRTTALVKHAEKREKLKKAGRI